VKISYVLLLLGVISVAAGCSRSTRLTYPFPKHSVSAAVDIIPGFYFVAGKNGGTITNAELKAALRWADVILIGETHDSQSDHDLQARLLEYVHSIHPGETALAMEQLERNEQPLIAKYLAGEISKDEFIDETNSRNWGGENSWEKFYHPMIDFAKKHQLSVIGANTPRTYTKMAWKEGYKKLETLPAEEQALFDFPVDTRDRKYRKRFNAVMKEHGGEMTKQQMSDMYRSQKLWDATMAQSILNAWSPGAKVVHLVGRFHIEHDGGLVLQLAARNPELKILTILPAQPDKPFENAADLIAYKDDS
jgi:uncharacterized iron-regulated protein